MAEAAKPYIKADLVVQAVNYPGLIPRQDLVDFCQAALPNLQKTTRELLESVELLERSRAGDIHTIHAINESIMENVGYQKALRDVCEWARENIVESPPVGDLEDEIAAAKKELKERFNSEVN